MAKAIIINPVGGCIRHQGVNYIPGEPFACEGTEAQRLIDMGVAEAVTAEKVVRQKQPTAAELAAAKKAELLASIAVAASVEELAALMPEDEPAAEIQEAFAARLAELEVGE